MSELFERAIRESQVWTLMMEDWYSWGNKPNVHALYVRYDSQKTITTRDLVGRTGQTNMNYIDYPQLLEPKKTRLSNHPYLRKPTPEEYEVWSKVLKEALENETS
jgi:hypothetical protein